MTIPHTIHQVWVGPPMPLDLTVYCAQWEAMYPDWEYVVWREASLHWLELQDLYDRAEELAPRNVGQFRSDIARLEILWRHGGVYVDCDMQPLRRWDRLLERHRGVVFRHPTPTRKPKPGYDWLASGVLAFEPQHPAVRAAIDGLPANVARHAGMRAPFTTGPRYLTGVWKDRTDLTILPAPLVYPYGVKELHRANERFLGSYAVHHWHNARSGGHTEDMA